MEIIENLLRRGCKIIIGATILFTLLSCVGTSESTNGQGTFEIVSSESLTHGQKHLSRLQKWGETAKCWNEALVQFQSGCKHLSSVDQSRLAIALTNCHLARSGHPIFPCSESQSIEECTRPMDKADFIIYTEFFTNAVNICFFIRNQRWQEDTELIINQLSVSSIETVMKLKQSLQHHKEVLQKQNDSLQNQELIIQNERILKESLKNSTEDMTNILTKANIIAQQNYRIIQGAFTSITESLHYLTSLQMLLLGEFSTIYTTIYYIISICLAYLLTTTPATANARIWMYLILTINAIFERLLTAVLHNAMPVDGKAKNIVYNTTWICRRIFIGICCTVLVISYIKYRDYAKINNTLLKKIAEQNMEIRALLNDRSLRLKEAKILSRLDPADEKHTSKVVKKQSPDQTYKRCQQIINRNNKKLLANLPDSGISDNCESDVEIKRASRPKTPRILHFLSQDNKKLQDTVATPDRMSRSPTHYNLRQQFGYKASATKDNCATKYSKSPVTVKVKKNNIKSSQDLTSVKVELFSEED